MFLSLNKIGHRRSSQVTEAEQPAKYDNMVYLSMSRYSRIYRGQVSTSSTVCVTAMQNTRQWPEAYLMTILCDRCVLMCQQDEKHSYPDTAYDPFTGVLMCQCYVKLGYRSTQDWNRDNEHLAQYLKVVVQQSLEG